MIQKVIMLGNEAIARGAYEAGVKVSAAYPGTPSTEISESIIKYKEIYAEWSPNEKVAAEVAIGASLAGVRSLASMKQVGLNVAADPLYTFSYMGVNAGMVFVVADDPGLYSSQNEQDTRAVARAAHVPVLEPSDSQEAKDFVKFAYELSEKYDTPVIVRTTTRLSHSQGIVELGDRAEVADKPYQKDIKKNVMIPAFAKLRHIVVEQRDIKLADDASEMPINRVELNDTKIGIITSGISYQYVKEALPQASVLKLGMINPLPRKLIQEFAAKVEKLYIVEELEPIIEQQVKSWGVKAIGKEILTVQGEYSANMLRKAIGGQAVALEKAEKVPARPPVLCPGCPHRSTFSVLNKLKLHAAGDIGCYTLGALAPQSVIDEIVCMGASISTMHGIEKARGREFSREWVAVIGDSTFLHTGINSLMNMVYNKAKSTVVILDNSTTGMTGHQDHPATGKTLMGETTYMMNIPALCKAMGINYVVEVNPFDLKDMEVAVKDAVSKDEIAVIIAKSPCIMLDKRKRLAYFVQTEQCKKCGMCLKPGCPAMRKNADGTAKIDETLCNGCGLCKSLCKFGAIEQAGEK
jgi:indolepyruvate ferredoxin oxidoreductase alpha subunit